ncbi:flagellar basal body-associated FliL family protein [Vibrio astriarenae]
MIKVILSVVITFVLTFVGFYFVTSDTDLSTTIRGWIEKSLQSDEQRPAVIDQEEYAINNVLVPINLGRRQSLLMLDISLFTPQKNIAFLKQQESRIKNRIIKKFSTKEASYFHDSEFIYLIQDDLRDDLLMLPSLQVGEVLITKAVFQ